MISCVALDVTSTALRLWARSFSSILGRSFANAQTACLLLLGVSPLKDCLRSARSDSVSSRSSSTLICQSLHQKPRKEKTSKRKTRVRATPSGAAVLFETPSIMEANIEAYCAPPCGCEEAPAELEKTNKKHRFTARTRARPKGHAKSLAQVRTHNTGKAGGDSGKYGRIRR